jgi:hypothetical protein
MPNDKKKTPALPEMKKVALNVWITAEAKRMLRHINNKEATDENRPSLGDTAEGIIRDKFGLVGGAK